MKKNYRVFWYNHPRFPFAPYRAVENFPDEYAPTYGESMVEQCTLQYEWLNNQTKSLPQGLIKKITMNYDSKTEIIRNNPEWFI